MRAIVFSKDRAMQLDACLRSLALHCADFASLDVCVLYQWSSVEHAQAYQELFWSLPPNVRVQAENAFEMQVRALLASAGEHVLFVTDDTVFVQPWSAAEIVERLLMPEAVGLSLRIGENCDYCYPMNCEQEPPAVSGCWAWSHARGDFAYPFELSSSAYRSGDIIAALGSRPFRNPNELEACLAARAYAEEAMWRERRPFLLAYETSRAFSVPCNRVQSAFANRAGTDPAYTADALLAKWRDGWRIDVAALAGHVPRACHEEVAFTFERRP